MKSLCLTCINLPPLEPLKTLTGPTMQYSGTCDFRPPTSPDNIGCVDGTPLWIDFEKRDAWEDAGDNISQCPAYDCAPSVVRHLRRKFTLCPYHRDGLGWDECSDTFEGTCQVEEARKYFGPKEDR